MRRFSYTAVFLITILLHGVASFQLQGSVPSVNKCNIQCDCRIRFPKFTSQPPGKNYEYIPRNVLMFDTAIYRNRIFASTPRTNDGVPATVSEVIVQGNSNCILSPYPSWKYNNNKCDGIMSVYAIFVDKCGRLWIVDSGHVNFFATNPRRICQPKVVIINLSTNAIIGQYLIPEALIACDSILGSFAVDVDSDDCENAYAYITDPITARILTFSLYAAANNEPNYVWWHQNRFLFPDPNKGVITINGITQILMVALCGITIGKVQKDGEKYVYVHPFASTKEYRVPASYLQDNITAFGLLLSTEPYFQVSTGDRKAHVIRETITDDGIMLMGLLEVNALACWREGTLYDKMTIKILCQSNNYFDGTMSVKTDIPEEKYVYYLSTTILRYFTGQQSEKDFNFIICRDEIRSLTKNTICDTKK